MTQLSLYDDLLETIGRKDAEIYCLELIIKDLKELWFSGADPAKVPGYCDEYNSLEKP